MSKRRSAALAAFVLLLALVPLACGGDDEESGGGGGTTSSDTGLLASIEDKGTLTVSTDPAYPPQSKLNEKTGKYEGFDIDVATEVAKRLGVKIAWEAPAWDTIIAGNWNGRWDVSVGSMTITPARAKVLRFTPPYYYTPAAIAVHKDNTTINGASDLDGKKIGVCGGCTYDLYLQNKLEIAQDESGKPQKINSTITDPTIKTYDTDSTAIQDLSLGDGRRLDAVISALPTLQAAEKAGSPIKIVGEPLYYEPLSVAIDKKSQEDPSSLVARISQIVKDMHKDGTLSKLSKKWYGTDLTVKKDTSTSTTTTTSAY
ncbi:MAG TPA: transporter substrate-binding domain-containing protein [Gaiellaceae bacterium]|nr:transporter substrate-binding domain-containing protein [Gaiellaceae bacterium]